MQVHFGVEAAVPFTDTLLSSSQASGDYINQPNGTPTVTLSLSRYHSETKPLQIGPAFRVETPSGLGVEVDALYQRVDSDLATSSSQSGAPASESFEATTANRWQFPVLVRYTRILGKGKLKWFAEAGPSISHIGASRNTIRSITISPSSTSSSTSNVPGPSATWAGITAGGGVDIPVARLHLRPEFRYSHWFAQSETGVAAAFVSSSFASFLLAGPVPAVSAFPINQNEASFVLSLSF
jgi:hypothetical protein